MSRSDPFAKHIQMHLELQSFSKSSVPKEDFILIFIFFLNFILFLNFT